MMPGSVGWFGARAARNFGRGWLLAVFVFLYLPIVTLVAYSFNNSPLPTVWGGFTLNWYVKLASDREILDGLGLSLKIAFDEFHQAMPEYQRVHEQLKWMPSSTFRSPLRLDLALQPARRG